MCGVSLCAGNGRAVVMEALVVLENPFEFDLIIGIDTDKTLSGMSISKSGDVRFIKEPVSICTG